jgi:hypothetical protein
MSAGSAMKNALICSGVVLCDARRNQQIMKQLRS